MSSAPLPIGGPNLWVEDDQGHVSGVSLDDVEEMLPKMPDENRELMRRAVNARIGQILDGSDPNGEAMLARLRGMQTRIEELLRRDGAEADGEDVVLEPGDRPALRVSELVAALPTLSAADVPAYQRVINDRIEAFDHAGAGALATIARLRDAKTRLLALLNDQPVAPVDGERRIGKRLARDDTGTAESYGQHTWTTPQTVRDLLQNHLDATTDRYVVEVRDRIFDREACLRLGEDQLLQLQKACYMLVQYGRHGRDWNDLPFADFRERFAAMCTSLPLRAEYGRAQGSDMDEILRTVADLPPERPPEIRYKVADTTDPSVTPRWISREEILRPPYDEVTDGVEPRFQIVGIDIADDGSGYDSTFLSLYSSTKENSPFSRGMNGEGGKMSAYLLKRAGAHVTMRSSYREGETTHLWQRRPEVHQGKVVMEGIETERPAQAGDVTGSRTRILIDNARDAAFVRNFRAAVDPRTGGIGTQCLEYSTKRYRYPQPPMPSTFLRVLPETMGVCVEESPEYQFVHGLRVERMEDERPLLFSYDFGSSRLVNGRDRSHISKYATNCVESFWGTMEDPALMEECVRRIFSCGHHSVEANGVFKVITEARFGNADPRRDRVCSLAAHTIARVLGFQPGGKYVMLSKRQRESQKGRLQQYESALAAMGYRFVETETEVHDFSVMHGVQRVLGKTFDVLNLDEALTAVEATWQELPSSDPAVLRVRPSAEAAVRTVDLLWQRAGRGPFTAPHIRYIADGGERGEEPITTHWVQGSSPEIVIRPALIPAGSPARVQRLLQVELLATADADSPHKNRFAARKHAQSVANDLIRQTLRPGIPDMDALPADFEHAQQERPALSSDTLLEKSGPAALRASECTATLASFQLSIADLGTACAECRSFPEPWRTSVEQQLHARLVCEDGRVAYARRSGDDGWQLKVVELSSAPRVAVGDLSAYRVDGRLVLPLEQPDGAMITVDDKRFVRCGRELLHFPKNGPVTPWRADAERGGLESGCLWAPESHAAPQPPRVSLLRETTSRPVTALEDGVLATRLDVRYGSKHWNAGQRVLTDILQNHLDASLDVRLEYEVQREGARLWVDADAIFPEDDLVGIRMRDSGPGYAPDGIATLGESTKDHPLLSGRNGEALKLIAAASARGGAELVLSSKALRDGQLVQWQATTTTVDNEVVRGGARGTVGTVAFAVTSDGPSDDDWTSSTTLRIQPGRERDAESSPIRSMLRAADPRAKDRSGQSGLQRYARQLRPAENGESVRVGPVTILLDPAEAGRVYENGLLVSDHSGCALAYDMPACTATRERNLVNRERAQQYLSVALSQCRDQRVFDRLFDALAPSLTGNASSRSSEPLFDLQLEKLFGNAASPPPSAPLWRAAFLRRYPGCVMVCEPAMQKRKEALEEEIARLPAKSNRSEEDSRRIEDLEQQVRRLEKIQANKAHWGGGSIAFEGDQGIYTKVLSKLFPGVEELYQDHNIVETSEATLSKLRAVIARSAPVVARAHRRLLEENAIKTERNEDTVVDQIGRAIAGPLRAAGRLLRFLGLRSRPAPPALPAYEATEEFWSNEQALAAHPESLYLDSGGAYGCAECAGKRIGLNESLLEPENRALLVEVIRHELGHCFSGLRDYTDDFVILLLAIAEENCGEDI